MTPSAGRRTPHEFIVIDQTTPEEISPIAFAALKGHERRGLYRVIEYSMKSVLHEKRDNCAECCSID
jgi:hypothetical protein